MEWFYASSGRGFKEDKPSPRTYRAISPTNYVDVAFTDKLRDRAGDSVVGVVVRNLGAAERMKLRLDAFSDHENDSSQQSGALMETFSDELVNAFDAIPEEQRRRLLSLSAQIGEAYFETMTSADVGTEWRDRAILWAELNKLEIPLVEKNLIYQLLEEIAEPRYKTDQRLTASVRNSEKKDIPLIERRMEVGDVIVRQGDNVTPSVAGTLRKQGYLEDKFPLTQWGIMCILVLVLPLLMDIVTHERQGARRLDDSTWNCVVLVVATGWICEAGYVLFGIDIGGVLAAVTVAFLCLPGRFAFHAALVGTVSGVFLTSEFSAYVVLSSLILSFTAATIGFYALAKIGSLKDLRTKVFFMGIFLAVVNESVRALLDLPVLEWQRGGCFVLFEYTTTFLAVSFLLTAEGAIGTLSVLKAREMSHPSNPLLRKLQTEAPGTYHHCLMIGSLADAVAKELGMDENLMLVGAYYHDIGKMYRPRHFVENQLGGENIHDTLSPTLSAVAIIAHVREGVELANEFRLPKKVKQFITEHHGTTCVNYFYKKALAQGENVEREQFCYPGPKPQSRETALLMLLDSLEAAVRSEREIISTVADIQEIVERIVNIKISEKQFDEADFTFKELELIKAASARALQSMYHTRTVKEIKDKNKHK